MHFSNLRRIAGVSLACAGAALLSGCFMVPGQFESEMELMADGSFTYSYDGEVTLLGLTELAGSGPFSRGSAADVDLDEPCYDYSWETEDAMEEAAAVEADAAAEALAEADVEEAAEPMEGSAASPGTNATIMAPRVTTQAVESVDYSWEDSRIERECTAEELADRKDSAERAKERREREAKQMAALFGGIDPTDPDAGNKIAERLRRQYGWEKVDYTGNGKFDIEYRVSSRMTHDFAFPMVEGMTAAQPFLYAYRRDGAVRIDAPGLAVNQASPYPGNSMGMGGINLLAFAIAMDSDGGDSEELIEGIGNIGGTFTLITDGEVLANNTDEGFERMDDGRRRMVWTLDATSKVAPMALIGL
ncbi:hypothetical protein QQS45_13555 [Alteriqipengyuania flavescens]|uniref:hypothetical protein n=1 Tax=Alteriqipengyuania flavescens TaxID=3053610 RepID=UPI0025B50184|nr:hypothetical protein [Alteriqipengyuania flavescens]WJY18613.1 hypothetical protein QQW98_13550 [Alteriqipengyuania flavescens]WJY24553.1 hypothetical protein QQS45_13555 [Alteriqipengyuania flavescens]